MTALKEKIILDRNASILDDSLSGMAATDIAVKYGLSVNNIYIIIRTEKAKINFRSF